MKIGEFAMQNDISRETVRYYMDIGLIVPEKVGGQYSFDESCERSLSEIFHLKEMGFTLNEIKAIFMFRTLGRLTPYQEIEYYSKLFTDKYKSIMEEIGKLEIAKDMLEEKISELMKGQHENVYDEGGMDIGFLELLSCSKCGGDLVLSEGQVANGRITNGRLDCGCGKHYYIDGGILVLEDYRRQSRINILEDYLGEYIKVTDADYLDNINRSIEWIRKRLDEEELEGKVAMELGSGLGFALRNMLDLLPESSRYIAVDRDMSRLKFLKKMIEGSSSRSNMLFICTDFRHIPLKKESVDLLLDLSGSSNFNFEHADNLLQFVDPLLRREVSLIGSYILFGRFGAYSQIPEDFRKNFKLENVKEGIRNAGFEELGERISEDLNSGGKFEDYFEKDERVYTMQFYGKRK